MPWKEWSTMSLRKEFVMLAAGQVIPVRTLCVRYGISAKTAYKWIERYTQEGENGLEDRSRRPHHTPSKTSSSLEKEVCSIRDAHPVWGGRKIRQYLIRKGSASPSASTVSKILKRSGRISPEQSSGHTPWKRFERGAPNELWQMDFKGDFPVGSLRCHPLTVLDDHSRFSVCLKACDNERTDTVKDSLVSVFRCYGLPDCILMDNGSPFGDDAASPFTRLGAWLIRLGIAISHGRPYHPQTQGKDERFHRTLKAEALTQTFRDLTHCQHRFDAWREVYNWERPHEALSMKVPGECYTPSVRAFPETLAPLEYGPSDIVRPVQKDGEICYRGREIKIGKAFVGYRVALRFTPHDGIMDVYFCHQRVKTLNLHTGQTCHPCLETPVTHV